MDLTGAEFITRYFASRSSASGIAVLGNRPALRPLRQALCKARLAEAPAVAATALIFDYGTALASAAPVLAAAKAERRAVVGIAVLPPRQLIGTAACQPAELERRLQPLGKQRQHVNAAAELVQLLPAAYALALTARRGPVLLEVPEDVLEEMILGAWIPALPAPRPVMDLPRRFISALAPA